MGMSFAVQGGGTLHVWEEGERVFLRYDRPGDREQLYKVWARGEQGDILLGSPVPEGRGLVLCRSLWRRDMIRRGCWPVTGGLCRRADSLPGWEGGWSQTDRPWEMVGRKNWGEGGSMLYRREEGGVHLAWPLRPDCPVPLTDLICLALPGEVGGRPCLIWHFDGRGEPLLPRQGESRRGGSGENRVCGNYTG